MTDSSAIHVVKMKLSSSIRTSIDNRFFFLQSLVITYQLIKKIIFPNVSATTVAFIRDEYKNQNFKSENALRTHSVIRCVGVVLE